MCRRLVYLLFRTDNGCDLGLGVAVWSEIVARLHIERPDYRHEQVKQVAAEREQTLKGLVIIQLRRVVAEFEAEQQAEGR